MKRYILLLAIGAILSGCASDSQKTEFIRSVIVTNPKTTDTETFKRFSGIINEGREIAVGFKTPGQISKLYAKEGDYVKEGQLLATLDDKDYKLGVEALEIQKNQLETELERLKKLYEAHSVSGNDYEKATSGLEQLKVQLQVNKNKLEYTKLHSPSSGYIQKASFETSELVDAGTPVFTLLDTKNMEVSLSVPSGVYLNRDKISQILCHTDYQGGKTFKMKIMSITPKADGNQLCQMRLSFAETNTQLPAGLNVDVEIKLSDNQTSTQYSLPLSSIFKEGDNAFVWIVNSEGKVSKKEIKIIGLDDFGNALTDTPLNSTDNIVRAGVSMLKENDIVKIFNQNSKTNAGNLM